MAVERLAWGGWENCIRLSSEHIEVIATLDVGPRIISFALKGGENVFYGDQNTLGKTGGDDWCMYGGHRLWHAPEHPVRTYIPDNNPVDLIAQSDQCIHLKPAQETGTGIQKAIKLTLVGGSPTSRKAPNVRRPAGSPAFDVLRCWKHCSRVRKTKNYPKFLTLS